jgi:hypothetical protein
LTTKVVITITEHNSDAIRQRQKAAAGDTCRRGRWCRAVRQSRQICGNTTHRPLSAIRQLDHNLLCTQSRRTINNWQAAPKKRVMGVDYGNVSDSPIKDWGIMKWSATLPMGTPFWTASFTTPIAS